RIASSHTDHRRGLVLGLTMAEVLLLLLFVLLLALTDRLRNLNAEVQESQRRLAALEPAMSHLRDQGVDIEALSEVLATSEEEHKQLGMARQEIAGLRSRLSTVESQVREWEQIAADARRINPDAAPAATLRLALQKLEPTDKPLVEAAERSKVLG